MTNNPIEVTCIKCHLRFCCADCRWKHEQRAHGLTYDCDLCRGKCFLCRPEHLNQEFIEHLSLHLPLRCKKCEKRYENMQDFQEIDKCTTITELCDFKKEDDLENKFDSMYDKIKDDSDNFEGIISVNKSNKTAVITPILRKELVDYDSSDNESTPKGNTIPHLSLPPKTPKIRQHTSHSRKLRQTPHNNKWLVRQTAFNEDDDENHDSNVHLNPTTPTASRDELEVPGEDEQITTPTSHLPHVLKLTQIVTTSTPTNPANGGWLSFPDAGNDSPLSEIEIADSPSNQPMNMPKLKSIMVDSRRGSDSIEKQVTFQDSNESSTKKKVTFADGTVFNQEEPNTKRVYRKPKRMLTPGPQKSKRAYSNPRFQALLNRFENRVASMTETPLAIEASQGTPQPDYNVLARAISFRDSPGLETSKDTELFTSCVESEPNQAITMMTANIASSLQTCLAALMKNQEEETEIQFKFTITKKKLSLQRMAHDSCNIAEKDGDKNAERENIWSTVTKVVKKVFWGEKEPQRSDSLDSTSSSASKRKYEDMSDDSPLSHKRQRYEGRIHGRPPIRADFDVVGLRTSQSAENSSLMKQFSSPESSLNHSF